MRFPSQLVIGVVLCLGLLAFMAATPVEQGAVRFVAFLVAAGCLFAPVAHRLSH